MTRALVILRPYSLGDIMPYYTAAIESVAEVGPWLTWCSEHYTQEDARAWVETAAQKHLWADGEQHFVIGADGRFAGSIALNRLDRAHATANVGYWVRTSMAGRGIATEAVRLLAKKALGELKLRRVEIFMSTKNEASRGVAAKAGARPEGCLRHRLYYADGPHDAYLYAITNHSGEAS